MTPFLSTTRLLAAAALLLAGGNHLQKPAKSAPASPADVVLKLPSGFTSTVFADGLGHSRHLVVTKGGHRVRKAQQQYVKNGRGIVCLQDTNGDGKADPDYGLLATTEGPGSRSLLKNGYLYASSDQEIFRDKSLTMPRTRWWTRRTPSASRDRPAQPRQP